VPAPLVLVVDDSLTVRRVTQRLLVREGYRVALAKDGLDALERAGEASVRRWCCRTSRCRAWTASTWCATSAPTPRWRLPVIMITSRIAQKHRDYAAELGVNHYLGKPYGEEELLETGGPYVVQLRKPDPHMPDPRPSSSHCMEHDADP
jgi:chemosensory pili system protein ChpA (sensor histidine kinase/response regulator)